MRKFLASSLYALNLAIIIYFWWQSSGALLLSHSYGIFLALGRIAALLAVSSALLQLVLLGRAKWLEEIFGLDKLTRLHRLNGFLAISFIIIHPLFIVLGNKFFSGISFWQQVLELIQSSDDVLQGLVGYILFIIIVFLSLAAVRKKLKYETWYFIHVFTYVAIVFAWGHQLEIGSDFAANPLFTAYWYFIYALTASNLLAWRFIRPLFLFQKHKFQIEKIVPETSSTTSVYISGEKLNELHVKPGQFMSFRFLQKEFWWQAHPFSISRPANGKNLRISVKAVGDFTSQIKNLKPGTKVIIEGPFGVFTSERAKKNKFLFIAGGIGITPIRSIFEEVVAQGKDSILLYGNRHRGDIVFEAEFKDLEKEYARVAHVMSSDNSYPGEKGWIDEEKILRLVPDYKEREIYLCGPIAMMGKIRKFFLEKGVPPNQIHFEEFSYQSKGWDAKLSPSAVS